MFFRRDMPVSRQIMLFGRNLRNAQGLRGETEGGRIQDTGYRIQDTRYKIQDTRYRIRDTGYLPALSAGELAGLPAILLWRTGGQESCAICPGMGKLISKIRIRGKSVGVHNFSCVLLSTRYTSKVYPPSAAPEATRAVNSNVEISSLRQF